jgi:hypothetical protein
MTAFSKWTRLGVLTLGLRPATGLAQEPRPATHLPVVVVQGPTVIAFWLVPASDSALVADPDLASALDDQQFYMVGNRPLLSAAGIVPRDQPGRRFVVREPTKDWTFAAAADSAPIGYLIVEPGRTPLVLHKVQYPDALMTAARAYFAR